MSISSNCLHSSTPPHQQRKDFKSGDCPSQWRWNPGSSVPWSVSKVKYFPIFKDLLQFLVCWRCIPEEMGSVYHSIWSFTKKSFLWAYFPCKLDQLKKTGMPATQQRLRLKRLLLETHSRTVPGFGQHQYCATISDKNVHKYRWFSTLDRTCSTLHPA